MDLIGSAAWQQWQTAPVIWSYIWWQKHKLGPDHDITDQAEESTSPTRGPSKTVFIKQQYLVTADSFDWIFWKIEEYSWSKYKQTKKLNIIQLPDAHIHSLMFGKRSEWQTCEKTSRVDAYPGEEIPKCGISSRDIFRLKSWRPDQHKQLFEDLIQNDLYFSSYPHKVYKILKKF